MPSSKLEIIAKLKDDIKTQKETYIEIISKIYPNLSMEELEELENDVDTKIDELNKENFIDSNIFNLPDELPPDLQAKLNANLQANSKAQLQGQLEDFKSETNTLITNAKKSINKTNIINTIKPKLIELLDIFSENARILINNAIKFKEAYELISSGFIPANFSKPSTFAGQIDEYIEKLKQSSKNTINNISSTTLPSLETLRTKITDINTEFEENKSKFENLTKIKLEDLKELKTE